MFVLLFLQRTASPCNLPIFLLNSSPHPPKISWCNINIKLNICYVLQICFFQLVFLFLGVFCHLETPHFFEVKCINLFLQGCFMPSFYPLQNKNKIHIGFSSYSFSVAIRVLFFVSTWYFYFDLYGLEEMYYIGWRAYR